MNKFYLNPIYNIKNDKFCSFIYLTNSSFNKELKYYPKVEEIPSLHGYILSHFSEGVDKEYIINVIAKKIGVTAFYISKFINQVIHNKNILELRYQDTFFRIPPHLIIESEKEIENKSKVVFEEGFSPYQKFIKARPSSPASVNIVLTTKCKTDCIYCYADRNIKRDFDLNKVLSIIEDCFHSNVLVVNLSGGDIFAYKQWRKVIKQMNIYNYTPAFISTKIPLNENDIQFLHNNNIHEIQFSLDSSSPVDLNIITKQSTQYIEDIKSMLEYCKLHKIKINIKTVLNKYNSKVFKLQSLYDLINKYDVNSWNLVPAFSSHYKDSYNDYNADNISLNMCEEFIQELTEKSKFDIIYKNTKEMESSIKKYTSIKDFIKKNKECIATSHNLSINIMGEVTICEMLYNREKFILGNIKECSIKELWDSDLVKKFSSLNSTCLPRNPESPCYKCTEFNKCKMGNLKKVCIVDVIKQYGEDKWDYPDPRCPYAPECDMNLLIK